MVSALEKNLPPKNRAKIPLVIVVQRIRVSGEIEHFDLDKNVRYHHFKYLTKMLICIILIDYIMH